MPSSRPWSDGAQQDPNASASATEATAEAGDADPRLTFATLYHELKGNTDALSATAAHSLARYVCSPCPS